MNKSETGIILVSDGPIPIELIHAAQTLCDILLQNLPFLITIAVVVAAATVTYKSNRKSVDSQNRLAQQQRQDEHANKISEFRHHWLQEVRETAATLCQIVHELQLYVAQRNIATSNFKDADRFGNDEDGKKFGKEMSDCYEKLIDRRSQFYWQYSKLKLLFKKNEPATVGLFDLFDKVKEAVYDFDKTDLDDDQINKIIETLQEILKDEWEVTKRRSWQNT